MTLYPVKLAYGSITISLIFETRATVTGLAHTAAHSVSSIRTIGRVRERFSLTAPAYGDASKKRPFVSVDLVRLLGLSEQTACGSWVK